ncbi:conserved hypothetical protein [Ricinus communis]|uniref:Uncharacterized protein n=1 Tax=Ricinus communis TaxID=3988 RepID=B9SE43_RICCO|nr:conserved hypothetical protein [Ricinus communis]
MYDQIKAVNNIVPVGDRQACWILTYQQHWHNQIRYTVRVTSIAAASFMAFSTARTATCPANKIVVIGQKTAAIKMILVSSYQVPQNFTQLA